MHDAVSGGSIVNQVKRAFNGLGQMTREWQQSGGAVDNVTRPSVRYAYSKMSGGANHSRLTSMTYPSGHVLQFKYAAGLDSTISRLSFIKDASGTLESYDYLGLGTVVRRAHPQPGVNLTYIGTTAGDAGDKYTGLDRFGRVVDQRWTNAGPGNAARFLYGYDRDGNRLYRDDRVNTSFGELYSYDGLNQLASFQRGKLNGTKTAIVTGTVSRSQDWDYDSVGNWDGIDVDGVTQARTANAQNQITGVSGATTPAYDSNGNMTGDETGKTFVYDAWNRLVAVKSGATTLKSYGYDGLNRRVTETASGVTADLFYSDQWQVLEERVGGQTTQRYVWSPVYVDAMVLRDRAVTTPGVLDERLWVMQDANFNVVGLVDASGVVVERYAYDPFGVRTVYDASYALRSASAYGFGHGFQGMAFDAVAGLNPQRFRWYSPTLGRWVSVDPIRFAAGDGNLYRALANNPIHFVDPSGLDNWDRLYGFGRVVGGGLLVAGGVVFGTVTSPTIVGGIAGAGVAAYGTDEVIHGFRDIYHGRRHASYTEQAIDTLTGVPGRGHQVTFLANTVAGCYGVVKLVQYSRRVLTQPPAVAPGAPKPSATPADVPVVRVYHKGELGPQLSLKRDLSTGTDRAAVEALATRSGTVHEFAIPKDVLMRWEMEGKVRRWRDFDAATGTINEELRFSPLVADELIKYRVVK